MENSKPRKTVSVAEILWHANYFLKHSKPEQTGERIGTASMIDLILFASHNYRGFGYVEMKTDGLEINLGDETRKFFYVSSALNDEYTAYEAKKVAEDKIWNY